MKDNPYNLEYRIGTMRLAKISASTVKVIEEITKRIVRASFMTHFRAKLLGPEVSKSRNLKAIHCWECAPCTTSKAG